jgi:hypothetical protein
MRKSLFILSAALLSTSASSLWLWKELRVERVLNAELSARAQARESAPMAAPEPVREPVAPAVPAPEPASTPAAIQDSSTEATRQVQGRQEDWQAYQRRLMSDPKYREAWKAQQRLNYAPRRANLIRVVGLSAEQADAIIELTIDQESRWQERIGEPAANGDFEREQRALEENVQAMLGADKYARWQGYMETRAGRMQVDRFRTQLDGVDMLRDDQVEPLIAALYVDQVQMKREIQEYRESLDWEGDVTRTWRQFYERQAEIVKAANGRMHSSAAAILSQSQLQRLDAMLQRDLERLEAEAQINRIRSKIDQAGPATAKTD